jgi:PAS domain S-box-containing protein
MFPSKSVEQLFQENAELRARLEKAEQALSALSNQKVEAAIAQQPLEDIRESDERFRVMANAAPVMIWMSGLDKLCTFFNEGWLNFTGRCLEEEMGNGWAEGVHPDDYERCLLTYTSAFDARTPFAMDYRLRRADGEYRWLLDNGVPRYNISGEFEGFIGSCIDITERRTMEARNFELMLENERIRLMKKFIQEAAHEFRTPLSIINSSTYIMTLSDQQKRREVKAKQIEQQVLRITKLVDMLLKMVSLETNREQSTSIDVGDLLRSVCAEIQLVSPASNIRCKAELDHLLIEGTREDIYEAIWQLLDNAVRYTPAEGQITAKTMREDQHLIIEVEDTGIGISEEALPHIFETFWREDAAHSTPGFGLGLSIVKKITERHGGRIEVKSVPNAGTNMRIILPSKR